MRGGSLCRVAIFTDFLECEQNNFDLVAYYEPRLRASPRTFRFSRFREMQFARADAQPHRFRCTLSFEPAACRRAMGQVSIRWSELDGLSPLGKTARASAGNSRS